MPTMKSSGDLIASITTDMPDNNAGLISAADVRTNMEDTAYSINRIVASGDTYTKFPFFNDVTIKRDTVANANGRLFVESGILFPDGMHSSPETAIQVEPFLGVSNLSHNELADLAVGHVHTQYYHVEGIGQNSVLEGNMPVGNNWINSSGYSNAGFKFAPRSSTGIPQDILTSGTLVFDDSSRIADAKGVARAWLNFDASGVGNIATIRSWHNIDGINRLAPGKFRITFTSGTFANNDYVAIGNSNATTSSGSKEDFDVNAVGMVMRSGNDTSQLRSITYVIKNDAGQYVDSEINDFVAYGYAPNESSGTVPTSIKDSSYSEP